MRNSLFDPTGALYRVPLPPKLSETGTYSEVWDEAAGIVQTAYAMVDGSPDEVALREAGDRTARKFETGLCITRMHRVLEVGCGVARIGRELAPSCGEWHGVDISDNMIQIAKSRCSHLDNVFLQTLPHSSLSILGDETFDRVYSHIVLFHLDKDDMLTYIKEFARVLKPGGLVYFDTWNLAHPFGWQRFLHEGELNRRVSPRRPNRNRFATPQEVEIYVRGMGLIIVTLLTNSSLIQVVAVSPNQDETSLDAAARAQRELGSAPIALQPGSALLTSLPTAESALLVVDSPVYNATLTGEVDFWGWALHPQEVDDPSWGEVAVFCITLLLQRNGETPHEIGFAAHNLPRPDVAEAYSVERFRDTGWWLHWDSRTVENGEYILWVEAHLTCGYRHEHIPVRVEN